MKIKNKFIAAIDQGTTSSRAILFNTKGKVLFKSQLEFKQYFPKNGWVEHNPEEIWNKTKRVLLDVVDKSRKFNGEMLANFQEVITDKKINLLKFSMISNIKKGKHEKFTAKGEFSDNEFLDISMSPTEDGKTKVIQLFSDKAEPFISSYKFIKGFKGGKLEYESTYDDQDSNSNLKISNFKVSKVPALTQLLTLASLQGIADTLTGEGIRFSELEMDFNSKKSDKNVINIEEFYAIGPAISLLMEGYVVKKELVSLKGTLVPARTVNKVIGWIPVVGKILIGSKVGEGVFGVSFKMKGSPKDIKTTVNPIKTLTPRFVTRTLEKIKDIKEKNKN